MASINENQEDSRVLAEASRHYEERVLPVLRGEFGLYENNRELLLHSVRSGKRLRPFFCSQSYRLAGGKDDEAESLGSAAMELVHCCSLILDDVLDGKDWRPDRGMDTVRARYSTEEAVFQGTCLEVLYAQDLLFRASKGISRERRDAVIGTFVSTFSEGVTKEIGKWKCIRERRIPTRDEYWNMHIHSSGGLFFRMSGRIGALLAAGKEDNVSRLSEIGYMFGQILQAGDDIKDIKPDMEQGYYSLSVVNHYDALREDEKARFRKRLSDGLSREDVDCIYDEMVSSGSIGMKLEEIAARGAELKTRIESFGDCDPRRNMSELADFLSGRMRLD